MVVGGANRAVNASSGPCRSTAEVVVPALVVLVQNVACVAVASYSFAFRPQLERRAPFRGQTTGTVHGANVRVQAGWTGALTVLVVKQPLDEPRCLQLRSRGAGS